MIRPLESLRAQSHWFWVILLLAVALRLWTATYNTDANDTHLEVVQKIMATGQLPVADDCWQCYHVKAFHYPAAVLLARLNVRNPIDQLRLLQYKNVFLGVLTILLLWAWLSRRGGISDVWKLVLFALVALSPRLAAINAQVTNDTLVIFAATACFFFYSGFLDTKRFTNLWAALVFGALSAAAKASGLVVMILILSHLLALGAFHIRRLPRLRTELAVTAMILLAAFVVVPRSGYIQNYDKTGTALANNIEKFPLPSWNQDRYWSKAGTTSIVNTYFTFRWPELIRHPFINKGPALYPKHRTNHWAQLYARHAFSRFDRWPSSWATNGYWTAKVGQASMVLNLIPLGLLIIGVGSLLIGMARTAGRSASLEPLVMDSEVFLAMTFAAMIAMSLKLSLDFQTFRIMKAIYVYPGIIGVTALLARGVAALQARFTAGVQKALRGLLACLVIVYVLDLSILATDLQARYAGRVQKLAAFEQTEPLGPNQVRLDRLKPAVSRASQAVRINESYSRRHLTGGYRKYRYGFGTRSLSFMAFKLNGDYSTFETSMALADEARSSDGVQFEVWGDSKLLYRGPRLIDHEVDRVELDVTGVDILALKVQPLGSSYGDLANWLHPVLTK